MTRRSTPAGRPGAAACYRVIIKHLLLDRPDALVRSRFSKGLFGTCCGRTFPGKHRRPRRACAQCPPLSHAAPLSYACSQDGPGGKSSSLGAPKAGSYVPPSLRNKGAGGEGESMMRKREDNSLRVTNLSEDVSEGDLAVSSRHHAAHAADAMTRLLLLWHAPAWPQHDGCLLQVVPLAGARRKGRLALHVAARCCACTAACGACHGLPSMGGPWPGAYMHAWATQAMHGQALHLSALSLAVGP